MAGDAQGHPLTPRLKRSALGPSADTRSDGGTLLLRSTRVSCNEGSGSRIRSTRCGRAYSPTFKPDVHLGLCAHARARSRWVGQFETDEQPEAPPPGLPA